MSKKIGLTALLLIIFVGAFYFLNQTPNSSAQNAGSTYYVATTGSNTTGNGSSNNPWQTISYGISKMAGGDTLIIKNGTYTGNSNRIYDVPSGTASKYTIVRAENDWGVIITGQTYPYTSCRIESKEYIEIRGFKFYTTSSPKVGVSLSNHIKIIRCASNGAGGNVSSFSVTGSTYVLFEECYAFGVGRYPIGAFQNYDTGTPSKYVIFRRCVVRWDYSNTGEPLACFANYDQSNIYFQNCIAIDGKDIKGVDPTYDGLKGFFTPNGANNTSFDGCIVLNLEGGGFWIEDHPIVNITLKNCVAWDCKDAGQSSGEGYDAYLLYSRYDSDGGPLTVNHCTFGIDDLGKGITAYEALPNRTIKNSIINGITLADNNYALEGSWIEDYNCYYNNTGGRNRSGGVGSHSKENINPMTNSLLYLTRIESGSELSGQADDGSAIGANIIKKIGVSGTLYGEPGWDTVTNENLWPFPNEDEIKKGVVSFYKTPNEAYAGSPEMNGKRGFAADGNGLYGGPITLTSYIWEYLGNPCPPEICSYGSTPPPTPPNITLTLQADKNEVQPDDTITYTLAYQNTSSAEAKNIITTNPIPQGAEYVAGSATNSGVYDAANNRISWTIPALSGNTSGAVSFRVTVE